MEKKNIITQPHIHFYPSDLPRTSVSAKQCDKINTSTPVC